MPGPLPHDRAALDALFTATYEELRRLAARVRRQERHQTVTTTMLVDDAWVKLSTSAHLHGVSPLHFKHLAARAMRQVLVEAARRRGAAKRGGAPEATIALEAWHEPAGTTSAQLIALDAALDLLARVNPRQAAMVEARFFGGLDVAETAVLLNVSEATIMRDWRAAKAWLQRELERS